MDAYWKCLIACVMSLLQCGGDTNSQHLPSDKVIAEFFVAHQAQFEDGVLNALISEDKLSEQGRCSVAHTVVPVELRNLGVKAFQVSGDQYIFTIAKNETATKQIVFKAYAFKSGNPDSFIGSMNKTYSRINDDWAIAAFSTASN